MEDKCVPLPMEAEICVLNGKPVLKVDKLMQTTGIDDASEAVKQWVENMSDYYKKNKEQFEEQITTINIEIAEFMEKTGKELGEFTKKMLEQTKRITHKVKERTAEVIDKVDDIPEKIAKKTKQII